MKIVDESGRRVPLGRVGELVAGGDGVAHGYAAGDHEHRFEMTEEGRFYRTGDLACWAPDGRIEFHGRDDAQVKIGGHRIEFGAIEATLRLCPGVADACVASIGEGARRKLIAAVAGEDSMRSIASIRDWLVNRLSPAEIPSMIVGVPVMPVTANGKSDRQAVVELVSAAPDVTPEIKGDKELLGVVMDVASEILGRNLGSPTQRLSDAGADSLDMVRISLALEDRLARPVDLGVIIQGGDAQGIASRLRKDIAREADSIVVLRGSRNAEKPAVYCIPGVGGTVFSYESLINAIGLEIPVLGLPYPGLNGQQSPMNTVESLADHFAGLIDQDRTAQVIVGYSLGGSLHSKPLVEYKRSRELHRRSSSLILLLLDCLRKKGSREKLPSVRNFDFGLSLSYRRGSLICCGGESRRPLLNRFAMLLRRDFERYEPTLLNLLL